MFYHAKDRVVGVRFPRHEARARLGIAGSLTVL